LSYRTRGVPGDQMMGGMGSAKHQFLLVVGGGDCFRRGTRELLETIGLRLLMAQDGREALQLVRTGFRPAAMLLDAEFSNFDDLWDFRHVQLSDPGLASIPVIVLSAELSREAVLSQFREVVVVRKPVRPMALLQAIRRCLRTTHQPTEDFV